MHWYQLEQEDLEKRLLVVANKGLSQKQVLGRREQYGLNQIEASEKKSIWIIFMSQFQDFIVFILLVATFIAGMLGEYVDALAIMLIVLLNGFIGFFQEIKAEKSLEKLKELAAPKVRVLRQGEWVSLPAIEAVIGDIVKIEAGDRVPADIRLIKANSLSIDESTLTGESLPIEKLTNAIKKDNLSFQDQTNMIFKSTLVTKGNAVGIVVNTGMQTVIGKIASLMDKTERVPTPLELKLVELGKTLIYLVIMLTVLTVMIGLIHGQPLYDMFLAGISLAVAVIPEGLPAIVTVALSLGVQRMIKRKAIVRKLAAVETLGSASLICTDKTGTITENKMTVKEIYLDHQLIEVTGEGNAMNGEFIVGGKKSLTNPAGLEKLLLYGNLCNSAQLQIKNGKYIVNGDPTDGALLIAARKLGIPHHVKEQYRVIEEVPFDSTRKRMNRIVEDELGRKYLIVKGAPEVILPKCSKKLSLDGKTSDLRNEPLEKQLDKMASKALRIIAIAFIPVHAHSEKHMHQLENDLIFAGFIGMKDPPRKEVKQAIAECREAGIKTVMITGDHKKTAIAIAKEIGLKQEGDLVLEGYELDQLPFDQLRKMINKIVVFARVTPEHKLKIVQAFQQEGHVVAMTGDGVNDAPAIKASNIGISMGISGTDVTKEASALILQDDNFETIKEAIREGRNIYGNIRKFIRYLLASNVGEIFVMLVAMILALPLPLVPVQILWINLITDGLPAMALGLDPPESNVMRQKPRHPLEGIFARGLGFKIVTRGLLIGFVSLIAFIVVYNQQPDHLEYARTVAFTTLVMAQLIHVFDCRSEKGVFSRNPFSNPYLIGAVLSSFLLLLIVIYVESLQPIFYTTALSMRDWAFILVLSAIPTVIFGFSKK